MGDPKQEQAGEGDDVSFLRTSDVICLTCVASTKEAGMGGTERVCLAAEGFGNRMCYLENVSDKNVPPDIGNSMFYIDQALSVRALQEMMSAESQKEAATAQVAAGASSDETPDEKPQVQLSGGGHRTLLYGHAVQLRHVLSDMFLACLSTCSSSDKLAFDVGLQEKNNGEACWWTIHPASKQRSEGEKVRVSDDVILVSVATERYLHMAHDQNGAIVLASFHQTLWCVTPVSSGGVRARHVGLVFGNDVLRFYHGNDECLTIPENWSEHPQHNMVIYEGGNACNQARSLWRLELARTKWHSALVNWQRAFRIRHITSGRYLGLTPDHQVCLFHKDKADFDSTAFVLLDSKDAKKEKEEEKEEEGMGQPTVKYGETSVFLQHKHTNLWFSYQTSEVTKKGVGKVEEKKAVALEEGHMDDCFTFFMAQVEESTSARVIRKCSQVLNRFLKGLEGLQREGRTSFSWRRVDLSEVVKLMEDLLWYFAQPSDDMDFEERQKKLRALRNRQDLFQEEGVLIMILDTIDRFSQMEAVPDFSGMIGEENQSYWDDISTYLYLLVAAMIKGNHSNCNQFASASRLDWLFGRLANPQSAEGILDVLYCVLTESPEALNMISEGHIKSVISLLDKVGRDPKVLDVLSSLAIGNGVAVRSSQNFISNNLLPGKDLLLQTAMTDHVTSMMPNTLVGLVDGSSMFKKWYFEAELEHMEQMTTKQSYLRVGWANTLGFIAYPGSGDGWGGNGAGDDYYSWSFDGRNVWTGGKSKSVGVRNLQKGDVIGCSLDLATPEIRFTLNGNAMEGVFRDFNLDGFFFPVMSLSAKISCRFIFGGDQGKLRYGPPKGFSAMYEASRGTLEIVSCFSFGDLNKYVFSGPATMLMNLVPFVPKPVDISNAHLPAHSDVHEKLAENMHELWAMNKIENGWIWGERRSESKRAHPCLTTYDRLPSAEKAYNLKLATDNLKTILALFYHLSFDKPPSRLKTLRLGNNFLMANGYKPAPLDTREIQLDEKMMTLVELLARNTHNVWAKEKISRGWTYGITEDPIMKRSPHLVPYDEVDERIKQANRDTAGQIVRTVMIYGYTIEPPNVEQDDHMSKENEARKLNTRTYRAEKSYAVTSGKWYFEFEILTPGYMKVGWMDVAAVPDTDLGYDENSYAYDGYLCKKWHQGPEPFGKQWNIGDVVGCFLDLSDKIICFSLNGEMLLDPSGAEMAFDNFTVGDGFVPAFTLAPGQRAKVNFGQDVNSFKYFTTSGLQEGFEPFCVNMHRHLPLWYNKEMALFENISDEDPRIEVTRIPPSGNSPPALKVTVKSAGTTERSGMEFLRLSLPVKCNASFVRNKDRDALMHKLHDLHDEHEQHKKQQQHQRPQFVSSSSSRKEPRSSSISASSAGIRMPTIPREFASPGGDEVTSDDGAGASAYLDGTGMDGSTENMVSTDRRPTSGRRGTFAKTQSLDDEGPKITSQLEPPALRVSASETDLVEHNGGASTGVQNGVHESDMNGHEIRKRGRGLNLFATIGQKMRDVSASRKRLADEKEKAAKDVRRGRSVDTGAPPTGRRTATEAGDKKRLGVSKDTLEAPPRSGQRHSLRLRRAGSPRGGEQSEPPSGKAKGGKKVTLPPTATETSMAPATRGALLATGDDDAYEMTQMTDQVDEYYYGVRIFPGQDPAQVWVGWVTPHFHFHGHTFAANNARKTRFVEYDCRMTAVDKTDFRDCFMVNAQELVQSVDDQSSATSKVSGLLVGCIIDSSTGELSFLANGKETNNHFRVEPGTMLFPATFVAPTSKDLLQFELGRIKYTFPLSAALFKSACKTLQPICPPRLKLQTVKPYCWARVPTQTLRGTALKLSEIRGWSVLVDDPVRMMAIYVPELDRCYDILEMVENLELIKFHEQTLQLYCALCARGNFKLAHILCRHVDEDQFMYAIKSHNMAGPLRVGFHDLLIALHLATHAEARLNTTSEYIVPLTKVLRNKNIFFEDEDTYPPVLGQYYSIRPVMDASPVQEQFTKETERHLRPPVINFEALKEHVMEALTDATQRAVMNGRDLIGGNNFSHFQPLLRLFDHLYLIGLFNDEDIRLFFRLLDPAHFAIDYVPGSTQKGLMDVPLDEGVKLEICNILNHLCDAELRHQTESLISFAEGFVGEAQGDQLRRYIDIKQSDMPPAEAAKQTKEFRCPPREQMLRLLGFKSKDDGVLDEEGELEVCPMSELLQNALRNFHEAMVKKIRTLTEEEQLAGEIAIEDASWVDKLANFVVPMPPAIASSGDQIVKNGKKSFRTMVINNISKWSKESFIENEKLIRAMFGLLLRQYNGVSDLMKAMDKTYVIHERSVPDIKNFIVYLMQVRGLLSVQFESLDEEVLKDCLWHLMNNKVFFQHPDLMRILKVNENVMTVMMNVLGRAQGVEQATGADNNVSPANDDEKSAMDTSEMVVACCKFLCYFCRTSGQNQKAMFEHLPFLLDNATMLLARPSLRGSLPLDVAYSSFMDNSELALALKEDELEKVAIYLSRCGLQPNSELTSKGYPDIGWDPIEGERYIDFLRFAVWVNGETVEENANLVIRLLIRRPECLGPALKGEGQGLFRAFKEAITMSEEIGNMQRGVGGHGAGGVYLGDIPRYPTPDEEGEDYIDMGAAILNFYSSLVDLLGKCAPDPATISAGKGESLRARAILRSLISLEDLESILSLRFTIPNVLAPAPVEEGVAGSESGGLLPSHKQAILLFLERVYGIESQEMFFRLLEQSFLPDLRAATMLDHPSAAESDVALALNRYLCNAVLPLLSYHSYYFSGADHQATLLDATLHTVYRMSKLRSATNNQRASVSDFLVAITREMKPSMMLKLQRKVVVDIPNLGEYAAVPLRIMTLHYERCGRYYGAGGSHGVASEEEKRLTMILFTSIFDSLGKTAYDPELFNRALPCLIAICSALSPDYTLTSGTEDEELPIAGNVEDGVWTPKPVDVSGLSLNNDLQTLVSKFAEHFHDSWSSRKLEKGWTHGEIYSRANLTHPRLKPFTSLRDFEKNFYKERCSELIKSLLAWGYRIELVDPDAAQRAASAHSAMGPGGEYSPRPVDLSNMTLSKDMSTAAEKMAENAHQIWAKKTIDDLAAKGAGMLVTLVPWDILTDFERRKNRFRAEEILKFLQYHGYQVASPSPSGRADLSRVNQQEVERSVVEKRFAYALLEKLLVYLENSGQRLQPVKPSQGFTRRHSFKHSSQDVKFFSKVALPLLQAYFKAHRKYFLQSSVANVMGIASNKEKEMVASLFCRMASLLRRKLHAFGTDAKTTVNCLQVLAQAIDTKTLVRINSDIVRTSLLMFFNHAAEDMAAAVRDVRSDGQYSAIRGENLQSWTSLEYAHQVLLPILTTTFGHWARNNFGQDLIVDELQVAMYKILDSLYSMTVIQPSVVNRKTLKDEFEKHRPALGLCASAFASCFPIAFLEPEFNANNKHSILAKLQDQSVQAQEMLHSLSTNLPHLDKILSSIEQLSTTNGKYIDNPVVFDVDLPLVCSYLTYWVQYGPDGNQPEREVTKVSSQHMNQVFAAILRFTRDHVGLPNAQWLCRLAAFAQSIIPHVTLDPVKDFVLPVTEKLRKQTENAFQQEDRLRTHPDEMDEGSVAETHSVLVRDIYAFFPLLIKFTDLHRAHWLKAPSWDTDAVYENIATIFKLWSQSQHFKREELNFMAQFEDEAAAGEVKTGKAAIAERKKKRREGKAKNKEASSIVVACIKRLLPVGLNVFGGRELDIVQQSKEKYLRRETEDKIRDFIRAMLDIPEKHDPTDKNTWQRNLYHKIGKARMRGIDTMTRDQVVEKITFMGNVLSILHTVEHPQQSAGGAWRKIVSTQRKRAVVACFRMVHLYSIPRHRCINLFLPAYQEKWLDEENLGQDQLIRDLTAEIEDAASKEQKPKSEEGEQEEESKKPDAIGQLVQCFQRAATREGITIGITEDELYMDYAEVMAKSIHVGEEDDDAGEEEEQKEQEQKEIEKQALQAEQARLATRGASDMVLMYLSACNGEPSDMVAKTLQLGIHLLNGGNLSVQTAMLNYLQEKKDVQFFTSMAGLMGRCSVLNLEMFERQMKAEGLGVGAELASGGNQNLNDADFTCTLFRFLQLTCEGHNLNFQNYLRNQPGNTTSVNLIICIVDYLLRLQESVMDFYWHYSSKEVVDEAGKQHFLRAISVCSQVFNTLTESIQGPCVGNQMTLANSRLWDAINGFFFLFAHMMDKLSKNSTQLELLREFLSLQKDMIVLMLSMLEGNVLNGSIGKQMVDTLVESQMSVELILKFFDMFLKLKDLTTSQAFQEFDSNKDGWISPKEFHRAMESQKMYTVEEINYLMMCTDVNNDGKVDYMEFTERFHNPAKDIGFNLAVLLTNLDEHITNDKRLKKILDTAANMLNYFDKYLGRIEIMGSSKRVEKVYFEIKEDWLEQWNQPQIKQSKKDFLFNVMQDDGGDQGKLESFVNFCEDTIYEMSHATKISFEGHDSRIERAKRQRDIYMGGGEKREYMTLGEIVGAGFGGLKSGIRWIWNTFKPEALRRRRHRVLKKLRSMTYAQLGMQLGKAGFKIVYTFFWIFFFLIATFCRLIYYMMTTRAGEEQETVAALPMGPVGERAKLAREHSQHIPVFIPELVTEAAGPQFEAFGIKIKADDFEGATAEEALKAKLGANNGGSPLTSQPSADAAEYNGHGQSSSASGSAPQFDPRVDTPASPVGTAPDMHFLSPAGPVPSPLSPKPSTFYDAASIAGSVIPPAGAPLSEVDGSEIVGRSIYEPKIADSIPKSKGSMFIRNTFGSRRLGKTGRALFLLILTFDWVTVTQAITYGLEALPEGSIFSVYCIQVSVQFQHIFARNYYNIKYVTLALAFFINMILLFYRAHIIDAPGGEPNSIENGVAKPEANGNDTVEKEADNEEPMEEIIMKESYYYLEHILALLSMAHCVASIALLIAYYQLKVPLIVFKREKEVARKLEFEGKWVNEESNETAWDNPSEKLDGFVISSPRFPSNYWDKFVKKKVKEKYIDQCDEKTLNALLGWDKPPSEPATGFLSSIRNTDWRYLGWKMGVIAADGSFQYLVAYVVFSAIGNYNPFFYAGHLIDVVISFPMLQTILKSVTHNGKQLMLTVMMVLVVVYLYTVLAFNFFRKFYVEQEDDDSEPDRKCHSMVQCFVFNVYAGVRAGGGIGDELESPYGDDAQAWRILFDMTFHFFVIIILLAIMQGLIIDAFGELRDQQDVAQEKLESNCFICDIGKDYFDKIPRGFERHTEKEHNLANYLFFLMHLLNKDETEYTGQETYTHQLYQKRSWEFIPVGECFLKQYEEQLMAQ